MIALICGLSINLVGCSKGKSSSSSSSSSSSKKEGS
jgi:hypothetical protein